MQNYSKSDIGYKAMVKFNRDQFKNVKKMKLRVFAKLTSMEPRN